MHAWIAIGSGVILGGLLDTPKKQKILAVLFALGALYNAFGEGGYYDSINITSGAQEQVIEHLLEGLSDTRRQLAIIGVVLAILFFKLSSLSKKQDSSLQSSLDSN